MVAKMIEDGATHIGVATDHVIESFRNDLWPGYKTGAGIEPALYRQFIPLEEALLAMGVTTWPMVEFEADDALAAAAHLAAKDKHVEKVCIWTVDKDLSQCVVGDRVVQIDRRKNEIRNEQGVVAKFGVDPQFIPDYLALVGDSADGFPGLAGYGPKTAATLINRHGHLEQFPIEALKEENVELVLLFKKLATLRVDAALPSQSPPLFKDVEELRWRGPTKSFPAITEQINDQRLLTIVEKLARKL
jgi:5'-3' exonuclease